MLEFSINFAKFIKYKLQNEYNNVNLSKEFSKYVNGMKFEDNFSESDKYFNNNDLDFDKLYFEFLISIPCLSFDDYTKLDRKHIIEYTLLLIARNLV